MILAMTLNAGFSREACDMLNHSYVTFFEQLGFEPLLVPNTIGDPGAYVDRLSVGGIVLTGGNDVAPSLYGGNEALSHNTSVLRDSVETRLLSAAIEQDLPVLGICRGMQFINVFFGGGLIQDLSSQVDGAIKHAGSLHLNNISDKSIQSLVGTSTYAVNSFHNQGVGSDIVAPDLAVFAVSEIDGVVEGIFHQKYPIMGIQWHPERPGPSTEQDTRLIRKLITKSLWRG